jgi:outer membrane autotransporter protein
MSHASSLGVAVFMVLVAGSAPAANAPLQDLFFAACANPTGALATRCAQTQNGQGNLSTDSESSLNPSQALGHNRLSSDSAQTRADGRYEGERVEIGPFGLMVNLRGSAFERGRGSSTVEERALDGDSHGGDVGIDYRYSERIVVGALLGLERTRYDFGAENPGTNFAPQRNAGSGDVDQTWLGLYASFAIGEGGYVDVNGGYGWTDGEYERLSVFQESTRQAPQVNSNVAGDADGSTSWLGLSAGHDFRFDAVGLGLYGGVTWSRSAIDAYSERDLSGTGLAMRFSGTDRDSTIGHAGLRLSYAVSTGSGVLVPQLRAEYQHEFEDDAESVSAGFLLDSSGSRFTLTGDRPDTSGGEIGLSIVGVFADGWNAYADYATLVSRDDYDRYRFALGVRKEF